MRCEIVAVGTELLLGQIVDTNSSWMGERLALAGIDSLISSGETVELTDEESSESVLTSEMLSSSMMSMPVFWARASAHAPNWAILRYMLSPAKA